MYKVVSVKRHVSLQTHRTHNGCLTPEKKTRSRPPSYAGGGNIGTGDSPITLRSRSSTCDSLQSGSSPSTCISKQQMPPPPPPHVKKTGVGEFVKTSFWNKKSLFYLKVNLKKTNG